MLNKSLIKVDVELLKDRMTSKAREVLAEAKDKVQTAGQKLSDKAHEAKDQALIGTLDRGIALLQTARKKLK